MLLDTLTFRQRLIDAGVVDREAHAIASEVAQALQVADLIYVNELASKSELARATDKQLAGLEECKSEMRGGQDTQRVNLEKMRSELKYEIDKLTASQKLDVNLERGRIRDELQKQNDRIMSIESVLTERSTSYGRKSGTRMICCAIGCHARIAWRHDPRCCQAHAVTLRSGEKPCMPLRAKFVHTFVYLLTVKVRTQERVKDSCGRDHGVLPSSPF